MSLQSVKLLMTKKLMMTKKIMQFLYGGNSYFQMRPWYKAGYMPDRSK